MRNKKILPFNSPKKPTNNSIKEALIKELSSKEFRVFFIIGIIFSAIWLFTGSEINVWKTIITIIFTIAYGFYYYNSSKKYNPPLYDKITNYLLILMLISLSITLVAFPYSDSILTQLSFLIGFFILIIFAFFLTLLNIYRSVKKLLNEEMQLWKKTLVYVISAFSIIILFGLIFGFIGNSTDQALKKTIEDTKIDPIDYYYFSFQVFYGNGFGELVPNNNLVQIFLVIETITSFVIHILILGSQFKKSD